MFKYVHLSDTLKRFLMSTDIYSCYDDVNWKVVYEEIKESLQQDESQQVTVEAIKAHFLQKLSRPENLVKTFEEI